MKHNFLLTITTCAMFIFTGYAQESTTTDTPSTIDDQFTELIKSSNSYEDYKVIKKFKINALQKNTKQRIDGLKNEIGNLNETIATQKTEIAKLNTSLSETQETLEATNQEKDSMSFFGNQMSKGSYQTMVWSIAGVLLLGLLFFIFKYKNSNAVTKEARHKLDEVEIEFEEYRKKALEKEQKLGRQLQDERNKLLKVTKG